MNTPKNDRSSLKAKANLNHVLDFIRGLILQLHRGAFRRPRLVIYSTFIVLVLGLGFSSRVRFLLSIDDLIDADFKTYASLKKINHAFQDHSTILLSVESDERPTKDFLCRLQNWIVQTTDHRDDLIRITTSFGVPSVEATETEFRMPSAFELRCTDMKDPEEAKIDAAFKHLRGSPWRDIMTLDPLYGITILFSVDDPKDQKYGSIDTAIVGELQKDFDKTFSQDQPKIRTFWGGVTAYQSHLRHAFDQTLALNGLTYVIAWILLRLFFGSWWIGTLFNATAVATSLVTYGLMGALKFPIDSLSNSVGLMIMIACLEDFIFLAYGVRRLGWSLRTSLRRFLLPSFFTSLTTAIGFGSLVISDLAIVRRFGIVAASAALIEWLAVFVALPAFLKLYPRAKIFRPPPSDKGWNVRVGEKFSVPRWAAWVLIVIAIASVLGLHQLKVNDSPASFFSKSHVANQISDHFLETRHWVNEVSLAFKDGLPENAKDQIVAQVEKIPHVHTVESSGHVRDFLKRGLVDSDQRLVERLWRDSPESHRLVTVGGVERAEVYLDTMNMDEIRDVMKRVTDICPEDQCQLVGSLISYNEYSVRVLQTLFSSLGLSLLLVSCIIFFVGRKQKLMTLLNCALASAWGSLVLLGFFVVFNIPLFFVSCICASVLVGLAGDNAIQFLMRSGRGRSLTKSVNDLGDAGFIIMICMIGITSVFFLSEMAPLRKLGGFMILGFILGYIGDVFILKGLQRRADKS